MLSTTLRKLKRLSRRLWIRVIGIALLSLVTLLLAKVMGHLIPDGASEVIGADALDRLLNIIATSMLTATTFSLTVMVSVHRAAAQQFTPRAHRTLLQDTTTQNVLATFVGAWIYAIVGIVLTSTPFFGEKEVVALYLGTLAVLALIVIVLVRWILHLQRTGSLIDTAARMESDAVDALRQWPGRTCRPLIPHDPRAEAGYPVRSPRTGYVQAIYEDRLQSIAEEADTLVWMTALPGDFVAEGQVIGRIDRADPEVAARIQRCIHMGTLRTTEQDPRFGLIQLAEIGSMALSPGVNDPGTAIDIAGRLARVLIAATPVGEGDLRCPRVHLRRLEVGGLLEDAFAGMARDANGMTEVHIAIQKRLALVIEEASPEIATAARAAAEQALERARGLLDFAPDRARLDAAAAVRG